jgi:uncharacterized protein YjiK
MLIGSLPTQPQVRKRTYRRLSWCLLWSISAALLYCYSSKIQSTWLPISSTLAAEFRKNAPSQTHLNEYEAVIQAKVVEGIDADLSSLTFNRARQTLLGVTNGVPQIVELNLQGELLRRIPLHGVEDPEAIEWVGGTRYVIAEERKRRLLLIDLPDDAHSLDVKQAKALVIPVGKKANKGLEGMAYDASSGVLYVANESKPIRIFEVRGFVEPANASSRVEVRKWSDMAIERLAVSDLSGLHFDASSERLLALSHESHAVIELSPNKQPVSRLSLDSQISGLAEPAPQAEGLSMDDAGTIYVVSEPNLFYSFRRKGAAGAVAAVTSL